MDQTKIYHQENSFEFGKTQISYNISTGRVKVNCKTEEIGCGNFSIKTNLVYNSLYEKSNTSTRIIGLDNKWKFSFQQYVFKYSPNEFSSNEFTENDYVYIDADWNVHRFVRYKPNHYHDTSGLNLRLIVSINQYTITDNKTTKLLFNSSGEITNIISLVNENINKEFIYSNGKIDKIRDIRKKDQDIKIYYNSKGQISSVDNSLGKNCQLEYCSNGNLIKLKYLSGLDELDELEFKYSGSFLTEILSKVIKEAILLEYYIHSRVKQIQHCTYNEIINLKEEANVYLGENQYLLREDNIDEHNSYLGNYFNEDSERVVKKTYEYNLEEIIFQLKFIYQAPYTMITDLSGLSMFYYMDEKQKVISVLKKESNYNLKATFKNKGFSLNDDNKSYINKDDFTLCYNTYSIDTYKINQFKKILKNNTWFTKADDETQTSYIISFWLYSKFDIRGSVKATVNLDYEDSFNKYQYSNYVYLQNGNSLTYQYVEIPIVINKAFKRSISNPNITISIEQPNNYYYIGNIYLKKGNFSDIYFKDTNNNYISYKKINKISYLNLSNEELEFNLDNEMYFTYNDLIETYKNYYTRTNIIDGYEVVCCNGTKVFNCIIIRFVCDDTAILPVVVNGTTNFRLKNITKFIKDNHLLVDQVVSFRDDLINNSYYYEFKTIIGPAMEIVDLTDQYSTCIYKWINKDGSLRAEKDERNIITHYYYDSYGNFDHLLVFKENNEATPIYTLYYEYDNYGNYEVSLRSKVVNIFENGVKTSYQYQLDKIKKIQNYDNIIEYVYNDEADTLLNINHYNSENSEEKEENQINSNYKGLIKQIQHNNTNNYDFGYDNYGRFTKLHLNNKKYLEMFLPSLDYQAEKLVTTMWLNRYRIDKYDDFGQLISTEYFKGNNTNGESVKNYYYYEFEDPVCSTEENLEYYEKNLKVEDNFTGSIHEFYVNEFNSSNKYEQKDTQGNLKQVIIQLPNETVYDIIENDQNDFKYKVVNTTEQENENNNNFKCFNPNILSTNYYQYQDDEYLNFPELKHQYIYDNENRYLGYTGYNVNEFKCRSILYDTNDDPNEYNNVSISLNYNKEILYNYTTNNSGYQNASYHKLPTEFKYNYFINSSNRYSPINTYFDFKIHYNSKGLIDTFEYTGNNLVSANLLKDNIVVETLPKHIYRYDYDGLNRIKSETIEQHNPVDGSINTNTINYSYTSDGTLITDKEFLVDEFNRVIDYNNAMFEYDFRNQLSKISKYQKNEHNNKVISDEIIFKYDDFGRRVEKLTNDYIIKYYYEDNKLIQENCYDHQNNLIYRFVYTYNIEGICGVIVYYYGNLLTENTALINYVRSGIVYNYVKDPFGNISKIIRNNKLIYEYHYDAWGNHSTNSYIDLNNSLAMIDEFILENNPFRYRGYYYDVETSLFWLSSRYYSPELCRFISPDDVEYLDSESVNGLNLYCYCMNDPINLCDPSGHSPEWWQWALNGLTLAAGIACCYIAGGQVFGVGLIVAGASGLASNTMDAMGLDGKTASLISSGLSIVAGGALCFTPFAGIGAGLIGQGVGGIAGGYISEALGGSFELGATIGGIAGSIAGGFAYRGIMSYKLSHMSPYQKGAMGERYVKALYGNKVFKPTNGANRPDLLFKNGSALIEVKNVASQGLTSQLNRYLGMGYGRNIIYVRLGTKVSSALKSSVYIIKYLPW